MSFLTPSPDTGMHLRTVLLFPLLLAALPARAGSPACNSDRTPDPCRQNCGSAFRSDDPRIGDGARAAGVSTEAFVRQLQSSADAVTLSARAVARAQGLDAASTERYVAARVAAFVSAERRRLTAAASPEVRAAVGLSADEMGTSASAGVLVVLGAITVVAGAARRLRRDPA